LRASKKISQVVIIPKAVLNWSSGKDAALAFHQINEKKEYRIEKLITTLNQDFDRVFMHGTRESLIDAQAAKMNVPLLKIKLPPSPDDALYREAMRSAYSGLKDEGISAAMFGDIFLEDLRAYRDARLAELDLEGIYPLWKRDTKELLTMLEQTGIEAVIVCVNGQVLDKEYLGKKISPALAETFPPGVDPCGENGEFHTFVYNAPFFSSPIDIRLGDVVVREYAPDAPSGKDAAFRFYFIDAWAEG
jgi:uncharacterized protein (TIGR00290 family)